MSTRPSFSECLTRCRAYGTKKTNEQQEKKKDRVRQQLQFERESYYAHMLTTVEKLQAGKQPQQIHYHGLYYAKHDLVVQIKPLYDDMVKWVIDNRIQLLEEAFSGINVRVTDYSHCEDGNYVNIWFVLVKPK
jgi:hypothetical protein